MTLIVISYGLKCVHKNVPFYIVFSSFLFFFFLLPCRGEAAAFPESADLGAVAEVEGVVGGHASKQWLPASMPFW